MGQLGSLFESVTKMVLLGGLEVSPALYEGTVPDLVDKLSLVGLGAFFQNPVALFVKN